MSVGRRRAHARAGRAHGAATARAGRAHGPRRITHIAPTERTWAAAVGFNKSRARSKVFGAANIESQDSSVTAAQNKSMTQRPSSSLDLGRHRTGSPSAMGIGARGGSSGATGRGPAGGDDASGESGIRRVDPAARTRAAELHPPAARQPTWWELLNPPPRPEPRTLRLATAIALIAFSSAASLYPTAFTLDNVPYHAAVYVYGALAFVLSPHVPALWVRYYAASLPLVCPLLVGGLAQRACPDPQTALHWTCMSIMCSLSVVTTARNILAVSPLSVASVYVLLDFETSLGPRVVAVTLLVSMALGLAIAFMANAQRGRTEWLRGQLADAHRAALRASEAKSALVASVSHEIRNPMNGVLGIAEMLTQRDLPEEDLRSLRVVRDSARGLLELLDDLLYAAKLEAGELRMRAVPFAPAVLVQSLIDLYTPRARQAGVSLQLVVEGAEPEMVSGPADRLRQVISNLCTNAIKFTPRGEVRVVLRSEPTEDGRVRLCIFVRDTGVGIPEDKLARIFERFAQADDTIEERFGGTGLGLHISSELVQLMGGHLQVQSEVGRGSEFSFILTFPRAEVTKSASSPVSSLPPGSRRRLRVLVADDAPVNRLVADALLRSLGHGAVTVDSGTAALERLETEAFDVLMLDLQMPDISGLDLCRRVRSHRRDQVRTMKVIALTGSSEDELRDQCLGVGMDGFLTKPVTGVELAAALHEATLLEDGRAVG